MSKRQDTKQNTQKGYSLY